LLTKDSSRSVNFGKVSVGQKCIKKMSIKNISDETIEVRP